MPCHGGVALATTLPSAHVGLVKIPGNFEDMDQTCGAASCHPGVPARLRTNIMTTMNGVVSVDRWVFGEQPGKTAVTPVEGLGTTPADLHLRNLCASCHLGAVKSAAGPITERSRGGGCLACHLKYDDAARAALGSTAPRFAHPRLSSRVDDLACFGCHSRSGRVSLNFTGWREGGDADGGTTRTLQDGRVLTRALPDVHAEAGLHCTDCHGSYEVMGDGSRPLHREDQQVVACEDCHALQPPPTKAFDGLDPESQRLARRLGVTEPGRRFVLARRGGVPLVGAAVRDGGVVIAGRFSGREHLAKAPVTECGRAGVHARVGCPACHEAWAPQCASCHTRFDPTDVMFDLRDQREREGRWLEAPGPATAEPAALGIREGPDGGLRVETFTPGMIWSLAPVDGGPPAFQRLFAPAFAHTIRREARPCAGCHASPVAAGYGHGELVFTTIGRRVDVSLHSWVDAGPDGLPGDAWVGFLGRRGHEATTRDDTRPFTPEEQRRLWTVGACLQCHDGRSRIMQALEKQAPGAALRHGPRCAVPGRGATSNPAN